MDTQVQPIILAAGKGTRFVGFDGPKVLAPFRGRPLVDYLLQTLDKMSLLQPIMVVGHRGGEVAQFVGARAQAVVQEDQLGTAHAVAAAWGALLPQATTLLVLHGDMPFWHTGTFEQLIAAHHQQRAQVTLTTVKFEDPNFFQYGRIVRGADGALQKIIEQPMASEKILKIQECNAGLYAFEKNWLQGHLKEVQQNQKGEFYLTDVVEIAVRERQKIATIAATDWREGLGINTLEQLTFAEKVIPRDWFS